VNAVGSLVGRSEVRRSFMLLVAGLLTLIPGGWLAYGEDSASSPPLPDTPAANAFEQFLRVLNGGDRAAMDSFAKSSFSPAGVAKMSTEKRIEWLQDTFANSQGYDYLFEASDEALNAHGFTAMVRNRKTGEWEKIGVEVEVEPSHGLIHIHRHLTKLGRLAPEVSLLDTAGRKISLRELRGKVVVLDFWATWCAPCLAALPEIQKIHDAYSDRGVKVIAVNMWEQKAPTKHDPEAYVSLNGFTFDLMFLDDQGVEALDVRSLPDLRVLDCEGRFVYVARGAPPERSDVPPLHAAIERELAKTQGQDEAP